MRQWLLVFCEQASRTGWTTGSTKRATKAHRRHPDIESTRSRAQIAERATRPYQRSPGDESSERPAQSADRPTAAPYLDPARPLPGYAANHAGLSTAAPDTCSGKQARRQRAPKCWGRLEPTRWTALLRRAEPANAKPPARRGRKPALHAECARRRWRPSSIALHDRHSRHPPAVSGSEHSTNAR